MDALRGIWLVFKTPRLWPMAAGPLLGTALLYILLGVVGGFLLAPKLEEWLSPLRGGGLWALLAGLGVIALWIVLFPFLFVLLGGVFFGLVFDSLSRAVERIALPDVIPPEARLRPAVMFGDTLQRLLCNGSLAVLAFFLGLFLGPIPGVLAAAMVGLLDYTSPAYLRRGHTLGPQASRLLTRPDGATLSFGVVAGLLSLVPLVGVFLMPGLIAGGTLLALRRNGDISPKSATTPEPGASIDSP